MQSHSIVLNFCVSSKVTKNYATLRLQDIQMLLKDGEAQRWQNVNSKMKDPQMLLEDEEAR